MPRASAVVLVAFTAAGALAAAAVARHDALVAIGAERFTAPAAFFAAHVALGAALAAWRRVPVAATATAAALAASWLAGAVRADLPGGRDGAAGPPIVLLTLDTFRADRLGALTGGDLTPHLDRLAGDGVLYTQAITTAPLTGPAHASMLTGLGPRDHGLRGNGRRVTADTVVPRLRDAGLRTGAFVSARVLDRDTGLAAGFDHYDDRFGWRDRLAPMLPGPLAPTRPRFVQRRGDATVDRALAWLGASDTRAFLWVHLYDPHLPYEPPDGWRPDRDALAAARARDAARWSTRLPPAARHVEEGKLRYDAEIRWTDALAGRLIDALPDDAVVVVVADHGESLDEHGYYFNHGATLWEESLHVPMIVRWPGGMPAGARVDALVGVDEIAGTLLDAAGVASGGLRARAARDGVLAWTPGQQNRRAGGRPNAAAALRRDGDKLVSHGGPAERYDLRADPDEATPLPPGPDDAAAAARVTALAAERPTPLDPDEAARLEALGYVE